MSEQTAVIIGATGLVGTHLIEQLLQDDHFNIVRILARKKTAFNHPKLQQLIVDFNDLTDLENKFGQGESIFCCIGTTNKKVKGDIAAYEKIDVGIPVAVARIGISKGFKKFLIVTSAGANINSKNFYLKLKGKVENDLREFKFKSIHIFRPGQLIGKRNENRRGEMFFQVISSFLSKFLFGSLKKYHSIKATDVAKAMVAASKKEVTGIYVLEYPEITELISKH